MNRRVTFKTLWLVSDRDRKARCLPLNPSKTLLLGKNGTGKSRITKNLFWVLGCSPEKHIAGSWDPDTVVALDFSYGDLDYLVVRQGKRIGLFSSNGELIFGANRLGSWTDFISPFFGYHLQLQRPTSAQFSQAGMEYLTLPFYLDQDGSWGAKWSTYTTLGQFKNWKPAAFEAFIGLRPNAYFSAKQIKDEFHNQLTEKQKELHAQRNAFDRVQEVLPRNLPSLDTSSFRAELAEIGGRALKVQRQQVVLRGKLIATVNMREKLRSEIQLAMSARRELVADLAYLSDVPSESLECPTCGTLHENSFHARLQLSQDTDTMAALIAELNQQLNKASEGESKLRNELQLMEKSLRELDELAHERKAKLRLEDIFAAHSKKTLNVAFRHVSATLSKAVKKLEVQEGIYEAKLKQIEDKDRQKEVSKYYADNVLSISSLLNVPGDEQISKPKPGARAQAGGSSAPRSMLAVHLALLRTNVEHGDSPLFPFVVDTPQQSGQDDSNLKSMIEVLGRSAGGDHQVILAVEKLPDAVDTGGFEIVHFESSKGALQESQFQQVVQKLQAPLQTLRAAVDVTSPNDSVNVELNTN